MIIILKIMIIILKTGLALRVGLRSLNGKIN